MRRYEPAILPKDMHSAPLRYDDEEGNTVSKNALEEANRSPVSKPRPRKTIDRQKTPHSKLLRYSPYTPLKSLHSELRELTKQDDTDQTPLIDANGLPDLNAIREQVRQNVDIKVPRRLLLNWLEIVAEVLISHGDMKREPP